MERSNTTRLSPSQIVRSGLCIGCGACLAHANGQGGRMQMDRDGQLKPAGPSEWYNERTELFGRTCPFSPAAADENAIAESAFPNAPTGDPLIGRFYSCYVGHVCEEAYRRNGSSGGMVSWTATELLRKGLVDGVAHVRPAGAGSAGDPLFRYGISRSAEEVAGGAKSRYYPIELSEIIREIREVPGRYAVVGIPCFIKAVRLLAAEEPLMRERIAFTLGLFCGHMKSARMVESFAWQMGLKADAVRQIDYRLKDHRRPANWYSAELQLNDGSLRQQDWWHMVDGDWGAGFFQNSACDFCDDVVAETADIAFGDAWVEPYASDGRGTNVVIVRSSLLDDMLQSAIAAGRIELRKVDGEFVRKTQAAGLRHRREGLALRLALRRRGGIQPRKRIAPALRGVSARRRLVYGTRAHIGRWSHVVFRVARRLGRPSIYLIWARAAVTFYHGVTYSRGRLGALLDRLMPPSRN